MSAIDLKLNIHKLVESIHNEQLLRTVYDFLKDKQTEKPGSLWNSLSEKEKNEVLLAFDESDEDSNLIETKQVFKKK